MIRFRDRLRCDASDRQLYESTKRNLAKQSWAYVQNYADAKTDVINEIMARAFLELSCGISAVREVATALGCLEVGK
jgi:GrpB protein